jgi:hypothetical protein
VNDEITREVLAELRPGDLIELHSREHFGYLYRGYVRRERGYVRLGGATLSWPQEPCTWLKDFRLVVVERAADRLYENSLRAQPVRGDVVRFHDLTGGEVDKETNMYLPDMFSDYTAARPWINLSDGHRYGSDDALPHGNGTQANYRITLLIDGTTGLPPAEVTW